MGLKELLQVLVHHCVCQFIVKTHVVRADAIYVLEWFRDTCVLYCSSDIFKSERDLLLFFVGYCTIPSPSTCSKMG
jgi:hypothetical protein